MRLNNHLFLTFTVLAGLAISAFCAEAKGSDESVALVNSEAIPKSEFDRDWTAFMAAQEKVMTPEQMTSQWEKDKKRMLLNQLIEQRLVLQEARKKGVSASQEAINTVIHRTKEKFQHDAQGRPVSTEEAQEAFQKELLKENLTEKQLAKNIQNQLLAATLTTQLIKDTVKAPTEEQVRKLFESVKDRLNHPVDIVASNDHQQADLNGLARDFKTASIERVRVQRILFQADEHATVAQSKAAQQKASETKVKLDKGVDFGDLAEQYSEDKRTAQAGGDIGYVLRGEVKELDDILFSIPVGGFSDVVKTKQGYQIFRIEEKRAASNVRYGAARKFLTEYLVRSAQRAEYVRFVEGLRKASTIDIRANFAKS